jgi:putative two-component system response regulator
LSGERFNITRQKSGMRGRTWMEVASSPKTTALTPAVKTQSNLVRILVVDDEPSICEVLSFFLQEEDHHVETAASGSEALELFPRSHWDLVITDRQMPGMTGDDLATWIHGMNPEVPIMLVTGTRERPDGYPFDACLTKPFTRTTLQQAVAAATQKRGSRAAIGCY